MYAIVCTGSDFAHAVGVVSRYFSNPDKEHWNTIKWILGYLEGAFKLCLCFGNGKTMLDGYTDVDMTGDLNNKKSISGYLMIFTRGQCHGKISYRSVSPFPVRRQSISQSLDHKKRIFGCRNSFRSWV